MKEMDIILGAFADGPLAALDDAMLRQYEAMLSENDQDLYRWITARIGQRQEADSGEPAAFSPILALVAQHLSEREKF